MSAHPLLKTASLCPELPGVYLFKAATGRVLYVGKSKNLHNRVGSYFTRQDSEYRIAQMLAQATALDYWVAQNEHEALILESNLIKHHQPEFNVLLKYGGGYPYLTLSADEFPRIAVAYRLSGHLEAKQQAIYGPYPGAITALVQGISQLVGLRTCQDAEFKRRQRPCLRYGMGLCRAPCVNANVDTLAAYQQAVTQARQLLAGNSEYHAQYRVELQTKMLTSSQQLQFEQAQHYKTALETLARISQIQAVALHDRRDADILTQKWRLSGVHYQLLRYVQGELRERFFFEFSAELTQPAAALPVIYANLSLPQQVFLEKKLLLDKEVRAFFLHVKSPQPNWKNPVRFIKWQAAIWHSKCKQIGWILGWMRLRHSYNVLTYNV